MKRTRFYKKAEAAKGEGGFAVCLDGKPIKTPMGAGLILPSQALAEAVAREWDAQEKDVVPAAMPLTRMVNTAIDRVAPAPDAAVARLSAFGETDLLCHWAESPAELIARQEACWRPLLGWAAETLGVRLTVTQGIRAVEQPPESLEALRRALGGLGGGDVGPFRLTALESATTLLGSVVLALALAHGRLDKDAAWAASRLDEDWQESQWGTDAEAKANAERRKGELDAAAIFLCTDE